MVAVTREYTSCALKRTRTPALPRSATLAWGLLALPIEWRSNRRGHEKGAVRCTPLLFRVAWRVLKEYGYPPTFSLIGTRPLA